MIAKFCVDCKYSKTDTHDTHPNYVGTMRCLNGKVCNKCAWSLASNPKKGRECTDERRELGFLGFGIACGKQGKLFEAKEI